MSWPAAPITDSFLQVTKADLEAAARTLDELRDRLAEVALRRLLDVAVIQDSGKQVVQLLTADEVAKAAYAMADAMLAARKVQR